LQLKPSIVMSNTFSKEILQDLDAKLEGTLHFDQVMRTLYATDASVYRQFPLAVAFPDNIEDIKTLIHFANQHKTSLIPRTAGTSLAGQCVGEGIVVDVSKTFTSILEFNKKEQWIWVEPGMVRDELNKFLLPHGLMFGPNTSTSNRCMIGGMTGNNSCGTTSVKFGDTRQHVLELKTVLSDGSEVHFKTLDKHTIDTKKQLDTLEGKIYTLIDNALGTPQIQDAINNQFPKRSVTRRNTGYALDALLWTKQYDVQEKDEFNLCKLLTGSEGTLAFTTAAKLNLVPIPPTHKAVICAHFDDLRKSLEATVIAMKYEPYAVELMDDKVLNCTKGQIKYESYRFFIQGEPKGILAVELAAETEAVLLEKTNKLIADWEQNCPAYAYPIIRGSDKIAKVWGIRKAGLGLLSNIPGDDKTPAFIEDTAVAVEDLPDYIDDFTEMLDKHGKSCVYYAHAGAGELHLRPLLNIKKEKDRELFRTIGLETAELVKKYRGSNSGEHGDGRVRGEFVEMLVGEENYRLFKDIKFTFDPNNIFNPGKIVDAPPMNEDLRYDADQETREFETVFDFSDGGGIMRMTEKCTGSGDCRKTHLIGGTMCPSYMATKNEKDTTRARANVLREFLTRSNDENPFAHEEIKEVMDLCLSCKGCKSECPSNVDMGRLKAEFQYQYNKKHGVPVRSRLFADVSKVHRLGAMIPSVSNFFSNHLPAFAKKQLGIAAQRSIPPLAKTTLKNWFNNNKSKLQVNTPKGTVYFFNDEFTNYLDAEIGIKAIELLTKLGYSVIMPPQVESGRAALSKGLLDQAKELAIKNVDLLKKLVNEQTPMVGVEPSAILSFRDEYPLLVESDAVEAAKHLGEHALMVEEFIWREVEKGNITSADFNKEEKRILLHGHCHQKALSSADFSARILDLPINHTVEMIPSGCCGMAGSFGYEAEHYEVSMQVGELVLFPAVRDAEKTTVIAAPGTSCRHQIYDGTKRKSFHPIEILWEAVK